MLTEEISIREAQQMVDDWIRNTGVRYFSELTNMAILAEEVGEVARLMSRIYGDQSFKDDEKDKKLSDELADVLWVILCISNQTGTDLTEALKKNFEKRILGICRGIVRMPNLIPVSQIYNIRVDARCSYQGNLNHYFHTPILPYFLSLSLGKTICFFPICNIQQFQGADFKIAAQTYVQTYNILLI